MAGRDNSIHVYDASTLVLMYELKGHASDVLFCRASNNCHCAISGDVDGCVMVWDVNCGGPLLRLQAHSSPIMSCDLSSDGKRAYTLDSEGHAYIWYLDSQGIFDALQEDSEDLTCCSLTLSGDRMVVGYADGSVRLWHLGLAVSLQWSHNSHVSPIECLAIHEGQGIVASGCLEGHVALASLSNGQQLCMIQGHDSVATCLAFSNQGDELVTCSRDNSIAVWSVVKRSGGATAGSTNPAKTDGGIYQPYELLPLQTFRINGASVVSVSKCDIDPTGNLIVAGTLNGHVCLWDVHTGLLLSMVKVSHRQVSDLSFSQDGQYVLVGSTDGYVTILNGRSGSVLRRMHGNSAGITAVYLQRFVDGAELTDSRLVSVCGRQAITWDLEKESSNVLRSADFIPDKASIFMKQSMDGRIFVAHEGLSFYDPYMMAAVYDLRKYESHPGNSSLFREGTVTLRGGVHQERLILYSPPDKTISMLSNETGCVRTLDFSSNGKMIVSGPWSFRVRADEHVLHQFLCLHISLFWPYSNREPPWRAGHLGRDSPHPHEVLDGPPAQRHHVRQVQQRLAARLLLRYVGATATLNIDAF